MKIQEANKIIAEYMGLTVSSKDGVLFDTLPSGLHINVIPFSKSIDALVPVWEKMEYRGTDSSRSNQGRFVFCVISTEQWVYDGYSDSSIQEAACIATAKAIKEIK